MTGGYELAVENDSSAATYMRIYIYIYNHTWPLPPSSLSKIGCSRM